MTPVLIGFIAAFVAVGCLFVLALCHAAAEADKCRPLIVQPKVTSLEARRRLLLKAREEQDWYAEHAQG